MTETTVEKWQEADARRLRELFAERAGMTQEDFGNEFDIGTQGMVWQYLNAKRPLNLRVAIKFARGLNCKVGDFSPTLSEELGQLDQRQALAIGEIVEGLPVAAKREVLDYLQGKIAKLPKVTAERRAHYKRQFAKIREDLDKNEPGEDDKKAE